MGGGGAPKSLPLPGRTQAKPMGVTCCRCSRLSSSKRRPTQQSSGFWWATLNRRAGFWRALEAELEHTGNQDAFGVFGSCAEIQYWWPPSVFPNDWFAELQQRSPPLIWRLAGEPGDSLRLIFLLRSCCYGPGRRRLPAVQRARE